MASSPGTCNSCSHNTNGLRVKELESLVKDFFNNGELTDGLALAISRAQYNYQEASRMLQMIKQGFLD